MAISLFSDAPGCLMVVVFLHRHVWLVSYINYVQLYSIMIECRIRFDRFDTVPENNPS